MKFSKEWLLSDYLTQAHIDDPLFHAAMEALGHTAKSFPEYWDIESPVCRPDCCSITGIAREIRAAFALSFQFPSPSVQGCPDRSIFDSLDVDVWDDELCSRLTCRLAHNVTAAESPLWMQKRLIDCGFTPENAIADIAQYVSLELGQPVLILDLRCAEGGNLILRQAYPGESDEEAIVLANETEPVCINNRVLSENAMLRTDTSSMIVCAVSGSADSADPLLTHTAVERVCELLEAFQCASVAEGTIDILNYVPHVRRIHCKPEQFDPDLSETALHDLLLPTGIIMENNEFILPSHRQDLKDHCDIMQEVRRIRTARKR